MTRIFSAPLSVSVYKGDAAPLEASTGTLAAFSGSAGGSLLSPCGLASPPVGAPSGPSEFPPTREDDKAKSAPWRPETAAAPSTPIQNSLFTPKDELRQMPFGLPQGGRGLQTIPKRGREASGGKGREPRFFTGGLPPM